MNSKLNSDEEQERLTNLWLPMRNLKFEIDKAKEIKWEPTGGAATDDFKATGGDYFLRVEAMDKRKWWYAVYYKGTEIANEINAKSRIEAMVRAEIAMLKHIIESK